MNVISYTFEGAQLAEKVLAELKDGQVFQDLLTKEAQASINETHQMLNAGDVIRVAKLLEESDFKNPRIINELLS